MSMIAQAPLKVNRTHEVIRYMMISVVAVVALFLSQLAYAQTGRPVSGVIAATDKPIAISYTNEEGQTIGRIAGVGEPIYLNDEITTPEGASLQVLLRDQTVFSIGPNSTLVFDEFIFDPTSTGDLALTASVKKGTFKFISGKISKLKPGAMTLKLPNATASVRGTSVVGRVDESGGSDIVLLTGAVQLSATGSAAPVDLITPGWGVSIADTGSASEPEPFPEEAINEIIQQVEFVEDDAEANTAAAADEAGADDEATQDEAAAEEEAVEEEAVDTVVAAVREAGEDVSEEEIATIIEEAEGSPEAVAEAIVKVIIENQIERGEIPVEALATLETIDGEALLSGDIDLETFDVADLEIDGLNVEDIKIEDLGLDGFAFEDGANFVEAFSARLDAEGLALPVFDEAGFEGGNFAFTEAEFGFDEAQFNDVIFEPAAFDKEFAVTETFDIKDVSGLILGNSFEGTDTPDIELSFFDILFNAETINQELARREATFGFEQEGVAFDDGKADETAGLGETSFESNTAPDAEPEIEVKAPSFAIARDETTGLARVVLREPGFAEEFKEPEAESPAGDEPAAEAPLEVNAPDGPSVTTPSIDNSEFLLTQFTKQETPESDVPPSYGPSYIEDKNEEASQEQYALFLEQLELNYRGDDIDPLEMYIEGQAPSVWLTYNSGGALTNDPNLDDLISSSYAGSARFTDTMSVVDELVGFKARAAYDVKLNYSSSAVTGQFILSNMTLNGTTYYSQSGSISHTQDLTQTLGTSTNKLPITDVAGSVVSGNDENGNGSLNVGETIEGVRIANVDFYDAATSTGRTNQIRTSLDMSVGSTVIGNAALNGNLGEFTVSSEHYQCTSNCSVINKTGGVGSATSVVAGEVTE